MVRIGGYFCVCVSRWRSTGSPILRRIRTRMNNATAPGMINTAPADQPHQDGGGAERSQQRSGDRSSPLIHHVGGQAHHAKSDDGTPRRPGPPSSAGIGGDIAGGDRRTCRRFPHCCTAFAEVARVSPAVRSSGIRRCRRYSHHVSMTINASNTVSTTRPTLGCRTIRYSW